MDIHQVVFELAPEGEVIRMKLGGNFLQRVPSQ